MSTALESTARELDRRTGEGLDVRLLWDPQTDRVSVAVHDSHLDEFFELAVDGADALDAFRHPYAYAAGVSPIEALAA